MKVRNMREVYWLDANASATKTTENVTPTTDIIELAMVDISACAPVAPAPNRRGHCSSKRALVIESASIMTAAKTMHTATITDGKNQKLDHRTFQIRLVQFIIRSIPNG